MRDQKTLWVVTAEPEPPLPLRRGLAVRPATSTAKALEVDVLRENVAQFLSILEQMLPAEMASVGDFRLEEVEISAEITGEGSLMLLGTGVRAAGMGGIKFVLRRAHDSSSATP